MSLLSRRKFLCASLGGGLAAMAAGSGLWQARGGPIALASDDVAGPVVGSARALGTQVSITAMHADPDLARAAIDAALAEISAVEAVLSVYLPDSQVGILNRRGTGASIEAHAHLLSVLAASLAMSRRTDGAFDVTVQPLWELYARAARENRTPDDDEVAVAQRRVDWRSIDVRGTTVSLRSPGTQLTFNGIAQGYATDRATAVLAAHGIRNALVDVGGFAAIGERSATEPWTANIQNPRRPADACLAVAKLRDRCLATSADDQAAPADDRERSRIFDPATGRPPTEFASVSVVAPTATEADALSTAVFVLGVEQGAALIRATPYADALFVLKDGSTRQTPDFPT